MSTSTSTSTAIDPVPSAQLRRGIIGHGITILALFLIVVLGLAGVFGESYAQESVTRDGAQLTVYYTERTRGGLPADTRVEVQTAGGFEDPLVVEMPLSFLELLEQHSLVPSPAAEHRDGDTVRWTFDPPDGNRFILDIRGSVSSGAHRGRDGWVRVAVAGAALDLAWRTQVMP